jgi:hypothetical protein
MSTTTRHKRAQSRMQAPGSPGKRKPRNYWTVSRVRRQAMKYSKRSHFEKRSYGAFLAAQRHGILPQIFARMVPTSQSRIRKWTRDRIIAEAQKHRTVSQFKRSNESAYNAARNMGVMPLATGHMVKRTICNARTAAAEAAKYQTRTQFMRRSSGYYNYARKNNLLDQVCSHMIPKSEILRSANTQWNAENLKVQARQYKTRSEFIRCASGAYDAAARLGIMNDVCSHMLPHQKMWTFESCRAEARKYRNKLEYKKKAGGALRQAYKSGWVSVICKHMPSFEEQMTRWTRKALIKEAYRYRTRHGFAVASPNAYHAAKYHGLLDTVCSHMVSTVGRYEVTVLHQTIKKHLSKHWTLSGDEYYYQRSLKGWGSQRRVIPDFILVSRQNVFVIEVKSCATNLAGRATFLDRQISEQIMSTKREPVFGGKKLYHILLSEAGSIYSRNSNISLSMSQFRYFLIHRQAGDEKRILKEIKSQQLNVSQLQLTKNHTRLAAVTRKLYKLYVKPNGCTKLSLIKEKT